MPSRLAWTGSIGVIIPHYDLAGLLEKYDVAGRSIASHPLKQMGSPTARAAGKVPRRGKANPATAGRCDVRGSRILVLAAPPALAADEQTQSEVFTGRIFTAGEAQKRHLVDELGFIEDAVDRAIKLTGSSRARSGSSSTTSRSACWSKHCWERRAGHRHWT